MKSCHLLDNFSRWAADTECSSTFYEEREMISKMRTGGWVGAIVATCLAGLVYMPCQVEAGGKAQGAKVIITLKKASEGTKGELIGVRSDAVVIGTDDGATRTQLIGDILKIRILRRSATVPGILVGGLAGGAMGKLVYPEGGFVDLSTLYIVCGALIGGAAGGLIGGGFSRDTVYDLTRTTPSYVEHLVAELRKKARVPDYR
jgi:hypothetical protein